VSTIREDVCACAPATLGSGGEDVSGSLVRKPENQNRCKREWHTKLHDGGVVDSHGVQKLVRLA
jgi:hypothetical protein